MSTCVDAIQRLINLLENESRTLSHEFIKWFYRDEDGRNWVAFNGYDSIRLEMHYRQTENICLELSQPISLPSSISVGSSRESIEFSEADTSQKVSKPYVLVRGGLFEVDLQRRICSPIYWGGPDKEVKVLRGSWFKDIGGGLLVPLEEEVLAGVLEKEHTSFFCKVYKELLYFATMDRVDTFADDASGASGVPTCQHFRESSLEANALDNMFDSDNLCVAEQDSKSFLLSKKARQLLEEDQSSALLTVRFQDCHVDWLRADDVYLYEECTTMYIRQKLGMHKVGTKLHRGFNERAQFDDRPPDVGHLCFVVHGIGQKMKKGSIIKVCSDLRSACQTLSERYFPRLAQENKRVEFLPVEWRNSLRLDGDTVDSITPVNLRSVRTLLNSSAMDIMYYTSPLYRAEISRNLQLELNRLYKKFCRRHPNFDSAGGQVSLIAHSLGCVIAYDLITGWVNPLVQPDELINNVTSPNYLKCDSGVASETSDLLDSQTADADGDTMAKLKAKLELAKEVVKSLEVQISSISSRNNEREATSMATCHQGSLHFRLENFFCLGSPLPVFLALRGVRPGTTGSPENVMPTKFCSRIFNIFHPADPVAYRLEPLVLKHYAGIQPQEIHRWDATSKPSYESNCSPRSPKKARSVGEALYRQTETMDLTQSPLPSLSASASSQPVDFNNNRSNAGRLSLTGFVMGLFRGSSTTDQPDEILTNGSKRPASRSRSIAFNLNHLGDDEEEGDDFSSDLWSNALPTHRDLLSRPACTQ